MATGKDS